ncbi:hypothetical protein PG997_012987 [Apiospora hydei]|uniref:Uncharacterized protein n=1 Tax=Apiospora hydei TaxID=1337664 RepID=A0ABR1V4X1_9PEZI
MSELKGVERWMKESIEEWFSERPKPTQQTLDDHAKALLKGSSVRPVGFQGTLSYTVIVTTEKIVSFRIPEQTFPLIRLKLVEKSFWEEFFTATGISDAKEQARIQRSVVLAAKLAIINSYCFIHRLEGGDEGKIRGKALGYLVAWLSNSSWDHVTQVQSKPQEESSTADGDTKPSAITESAVSATKE